MFLIRVFQCQLLWALYLQMALRFQDMETYQTSTPLKVDGNTVFDIASISKTFVAIILADMVNQGLVNLNDPIEKYLPVDKW